MKRGRALSTKMRTISDMHTSGLIDALQKETLQDLVRKRPRVVHARQYQAVSRRGRRWMS